jgi:hypothetical protein
LGAETVVLAGCGALEALGAAFFAAAGFLPAASVRTAAFLGLAGFFVFAEVVLLAAVRLAAFAAGLDRRVVRGPFGRETRVFAAFSLLRAICVPTPGDQWFGGARRRCFRAGPPRGR